MAPKAAAAKASPKTLPTASTEPAVSATPVVLSKPKAAPVVTSKHLAASIADQQQIPQKQAGLLIVSLVELMVDHLKKGDRLKIGGLGIMEVKSLPARMGRNPITGEAIQINASRKVAFRATKELKQAI